MIIYAFSGLGKSYYCKTHSDGFDADYHYFRFSEIATQMSYSNYVLEKSKQYRYVFVNGPIEETHFPTDLVFLPETIDFILERLQKRKQGNFIPTIAMLKEDNRRFPNAIPCKKNSYITNQMEELKMKRDEELAILKKDIFLNPDMHKIKKEEYAPYSSGTCYYGQYREEDKKRVVLHNIKKEGTQINRIVEAIYEKCYMGASEELFQEMEADYKEKIKNKPYLISLLKEEKCPFQRTRFYGSYGLGQLDEEANVWDDAIKNCIFLLNQKDKTTGLGGLHILDMVKTTIKECEEHMKVFDVSKNQTTLLDKYCYIYYTFMHRLSNIPKDSYIPHYGNFSNNSGRVSIRNIMDDLKEVEHHFGFDFAEPTHANGIGNNNSQLVTSNGLFICQQWFTSGMYSDGYCGIKDMNNQNIEVSCCKFNSKGDQYTQVFDDQKGNVMCIQIEMNPEDAKNVNNVYKQYQETIQEELENEIEL